ncbi:MAG: hypothetical protein ACK417_09485 [Bacteroidia bacterium]
MDLQARKLKAIAYLIGLQDEKRFAMIESAIGDLQKQDDPTTSFDQISVEDLVKRAKKASDDYLNGRVVTQEQLEKDLANW